MLKVLLEGGAKFFDQDEKGKTPLHLASEKGHLKAVRILIDNKSDLNDR